MSAAPTLIIRNIGSLVTCDPLRGEMPGVIHDAVVIASGGLLTYAGRSDGASFPPLSADVVDIDAGGAAVIPGFVDAHSHIAWVPSCASVQNSRHSGWSRSMNTTRSSCQ